MTQQECNKNKYYASTFNNILMCDKKYGLNEKMISNLYEKMISNLYKIKLVEEEANYKKEEGSITVKQWEDKEAKKKGNGWEKCNSRCVN